VFLRSDDPTKGWRKTKPRIEDRDDEKEREREREREMKVAAAPAFSGEPLNRVVFAEESWDHPK